MDDQGYKYQGASRLGRVPAVPFKFLQFLMAQQRGGERKMDKLERAGLLYVSRCKHPSQPVLKKRGSVFSCLSSI